MENNWERTLPYLQLNNMQIQRLLDGVIENDEIKNISMINEGCRTTNYLIDTFTKGKFVLKIFYLKEESYRREEKLFKKVIKDIKVPQIYKFSEDEIIEDREYIIYEYLEGETISSYLKKRNSIEEKFVRQVAESMAKLHKNKYDNIGFLNEELEVKEILSPLSEWYRMFMGKNAEQRLGKEIKNEVYKVVEENEGILKMLDNDSRLVHGDLQGTNILIDNHGNLSGILDWEFCMAGHPIADIGQFFRYDQYFDKRLINSFEDEYRKQSDYNLPENWYKISKIRDMANLIQLIDKDGDMPNKYLSIREIMKKILDDYKKS
ncbi:MAG: aminoglycoside phosphotransferase family protein [Clostridium butyricum]|nr:aminoglycoside phosphotransferase family protein [Clostridium butyricum]